MRNKTSKAHVCNTVPDPPRGHTCMYVCVSIKTIHMRHFVQLGSCKNCFLCKKIFAYTFTLREQCRMWSNIRHAWMRCCTHHQTTLYKRIDTKGLWFGLRLNFFAPGDGNHLKKFLKNQSFLEIVCSQWFHLYPCSLGAHAVNLCRVSHDMNEIKKDAIYMYTQQYPRKYMYDTVCEDWCSSSQYDFYPSQALLHKIHHLCHTNSCLDNVIVAYSVLCDHGPVSNTQAFSKAWKFTLLSAPVQGAKQLHMKGILSHKTTAAAKLNWRRQVLHLFPPPFPYPISATKQFSTAGIISLISSF